MGSAVPRLPGRAAELRVARDALPVEAARDEIHAKAGIDFDPEVAEAFLTLELPEQHHPEL